jgi:LPXTG-motif cell wall-anchored protein
MIDISGRAVRAGIRSITAVAAASCFAVMPQVTSSASAHTGGKAGRAHDRTTPNRDHDGHGHGGHAARDHARGRADVVVDTKGPRGAIVPGKTYNWPFEVTNRGTVPARDVALTTTPDKNLKVLAAPPKCHWRKSGPLVCHIGLLPQGKTRRGVITATVVPPPRTGKARREHVRLQNPVQVSWRNAPTPERRLAAFPPVEVSPDGADTGTAPRTATDDLPYPLMVAEHGPGTAESVVVRSPIGAPVADGPCSLGALPARTAGKSMPIKPEFGSCAAKQDDPTACACGAAAQQRPASGLPTENAVIPDRPARSDVPAAAPCGAVATRPDVFPNRPSTSSCTGAQGRPETGTGASAQTPPASAAATTPCGAAAARPVVVSESPAALPPCAQAGQAAQAGQGRPAAAPSTATADRAQDKAADKAQDRPAAVSGSPATTPCGATAGRPVILPARPVIVPESPAAVPPCAGGGSATAPSTATADQHAGKPATEKSTPATAAEKSTPATAAEKSTPATATDRSTPAADKSTPATDKGDKATDKTGVPAAAPCGATAARPVVVPGQPVVVPNMPAIPPCAQNWPSSCGCLHSASVPAAHAAEPTAPAASDTPANPADSDTSPCSAADKPMAGKAISERPAGTSCAQETPAAVHEEQGNTPATIAPMTPLTGPGKAARHPLARPHHPHHPLGSGRARHECVRQGTGFVCPLGTGPRHPQVHNLEAPGHPHGLHCGSGSGTACHVRAARPVPVREAPGRELPTTGSSSALFALAGLGLAGAGVVLYRLSRTRRENG